MPPMGAAARLPGVAERRPDPWGGLHRPDWAGPRPVGLAAGRPQPAGVRCQLHCPGPGGIASKPAGRLALRLGPVEASLRVDVGSRCTGAISTTRCAGAPPRWWQGEPLRARLELRSPLHDDRPP